MTFSYDKAPQDPSEMTFSYDKATQALLKAATQDPSEMTFSYDKALQESEDASELTFTYKDPKDPSEMTFSYDKAPQALLKAAAQDPSEMTFSYEDPKFDYNPKFSGYADGACPGVSKGWADNTAHLSHSMTLEDLRRFFNPNTPVENKIMTLNRDLDHEGIRVLGNAPSLDLGNAFKDPLVNKLAYHMAMQYDEDISGLTSAWRPHDILTHELHMNEMNIMVAEQYKKADPLAETCACMMENEHLLKHELEQIGKYFQQLPTTKGWAEQPEMMSKEQWTLDAKVLTDVDGNSKAMDMKTLSQDAAAYLKCKLAQF